MAYSTLLQRKQDDHLAGQIAGRAIPVHAGMIPQGADTLITTNAGNRQLTLNRPLKDIRGLGKAVYMGVAGEVLNPIFQPNSFLNAADLQGMLDYMVI